MADLPVVKGKRVLWIIPARRRVVFLLLFGLVYCMYGFGLMRSPAPHAFGAWWWPGVLFVGAGLITMVAALRDRPRHEWVGFTVLQGAAAIWAINFLLLAAMNAEGRPWVGVLVWALIVCIVLLVAGWPEPPPKHVMEAVTKYLEMQSQNERDTRGV